MTTIIPDVDGRAEAERIINSWENWNIDVCAPPNIVKALSNGLSNQSFQIQLPLSCDKQSNDRATPFSAHDSATISTGNQNAVLRIQCPNSLYPVDRVQEKIIHNELNKQFQHDIAPRILFQADDASFRITEFIEGTTLAPRVNPEDNSSDLPANYLSAVFASVRLIHTTNIDLPAFDYSALLKRYYAFLSSATPEQQQEHQSMLHLCDKFESQYGKNRVLCHHDLNPHNILIPSSFNVRQDSSSIILLDWEFAGAGIASMDFAALTAELNIPIANALALSGIAQKELESASELYRYLCKLYNAVE